MKKRILSSLMACIIALSGVNAVMAEAPEEASASQEEIYAAKGFGYEHKLKNAKPERLLDFERMNNGSSSDSEFDRIIQGSVYPQDSWDGGTAFACVGGTSVKFEPKEAISSGKYILSFDIWQNYSSGSYTYMRFNTDTGKTERNMFAIYGGKIGNLGNGWGMEGGASYEAETWRHVMMFLDFDKGTAEYMIDNEYVMTASNMPALTSFTIHFEGGANNRRRLDNFTFMKYDSAVRTDLLELGIKMPEAFSNSAEANITSKYYGNIFQTFDEVALKLTLNSNVLEDIVYDVEYTVKSFEGKTVWTGKTEGLEVKAGESVQTELYPVVDKYNIYTLYAQLIPRTEGYSEILTDREFSVVNTPSEGYRSPFIGHQVHISGNTRYNQVERIVDISGVGFLRTDLGWNGMQPDLGACSFPDDVPDYPGFYSKVAASGINHLAILTPWHNKYGGWSNRNVIAETPQALADWESFCEQFAAHYKGVIKYIELGNEINFARDEVYSAEEYADVCIAAYRGIKKGNPDAVVLTQGFSRADIDFVRAMLEYADGQSMFDVVALHVYQGQGSPEMCSWGVQTAEFRKMLAEYGYPDMEIWNTEGNTSTHYSYSTNQQHAGNLIRQFVMCQGWNVFDKMMLFEIQTEELEEGNNEHYFGMIHGRNTKNANGAKKTYLAVCNYNAMTEGGELVKTHEGDEEWFMQLKKPNGKSVVVMYGERKCDMVTIDTGTKTATLYDISGNPTYLESDDGKYVVSISDQPVYLEYSGDKFEITDKKIASDKYMAYAGNRSTIDYKLTIPEGAAVEAVGKDNMTVTSEQNGTEASVHITINSLPNKYFQADRGGWGGDFDYTEHYMDNGTQIYRDYVKANVKKDGKLIAVVDLPIEYDFDSADVYLRIKPYDNTNTKYLVLECNVTNTVTKPLSGTVKLTKPEGIDVPAQRIENLAYGETKTLTFSVPSELVSGWKLYGGTLTTDDGEEISFVLGTLPRSNNYAGAEYSTIIGSLEKRKGEAPVIDGIINESEWKDYKIGDFDKSQVSYGSQNLVIDGVVEGESFGADADYGGKQDFSGTVYAQWDEKFLYVAAVVNDDVHYQKQDFLRMYYDDHFYITAKETMNQRHDTRIDIGLSDFYNRDFYTDDDRHGKIMCLYTPVQYAKVAYELTSTTEAECYVTRKENVTIYEAKIPWNEIVTENALENKQFWLSFNIRDYDGDRDKTTSIGGRYYMLTNTEKK